MTPKEKADELAGLFCIDSVQYVYAKECALIAVNEIIKALRKDVPTFELSKGFWSSVRKEIKKL